LERVTTNDVAKIAYEQGQYSLLPNESGGCVDDIIVYRKGDGFQMVVNASNHEKDVDWLKSHAEGSISFDDITEITAMIAVQGPQATAILELIASTDLSHVSAFGIVQLDMKTSHVQAARSGYTGEDGFEIVCPAVDAVNVWDLLLANGVMPCGLGSRDTLRVETGLPLYGHELRDDLSPIAAGLGWVISKTKDYIGKPFIDRARTDGVAERLVGIRLDSKRLATPGMAVLVGDEKVGEVSSGVISPTLDTGLALAFVRSGIPLETPCAVETRGKAEAGMIVSKRFYRRAKST
jgi:aminomethyltransferase